MKVYKYRGGSPEIMARDLESIASNYFWASTADQLNDPSEAYVNENDARILFKALGAKDVETEFDNLTKMRHTVGVYSLSRTPLDELMWAYYAGGHKGFCIEYDLNRLVHEARTSWNIVDVAYHPEPQKIVFDDMFQTQNETAILGKMIGTKSSRWAHEKEVRIITRTAGKNHYAPAAMTGIYFGCRCEGSFIQEVRGKLKGRDLRYYKIEFSDNSYSMVARDLEYDTAIDGERIEHLAPIEESAIPGLEDIKEEYKPFYEYLTKAAEIVRRDSSCEKIVLVDFSTYKERDGKPAVFVQYETNVPTQFYNVLNQYFYIDELQQQQ
ncbi:DUF2971 domain-containing protein [Luteithermobacter gelatinilyticus]|uniref:DUF2971 domain-containing protein n=1 Tax=Luteithermobacter gelatinilyticus TaxID=2582913 RepID=UPI001105A286|nr:DUF2971 domain-containing protein [Luteithermobacter gelatinilyticus]|tara:strand:+ start:7333 stop:8307 length:975 start_codon:yes stop_codon:yes gene_type:complete